MAATAETSLGPFQAKGRAEVGLHGLLFCWTAVEGRRNALWLYTKAFDADASRLEFAHAPHGLDPLWMSRAHRELVLLTPPPVSAISQAYVLLQVFRQGALAGNPDPVLVFQPRRSRCFLCGGTCQKLDNKPEKYVACAAAERHLLSGSG